jgi:hypothetical protein
MRHSSQTALCLLATVLTVGACKGETIVKPDPNTQTALDQCNKDKASLTDYKKQLEASNIDLQNKAGAGSSAQITVAFEGTLLTVRPPRTGEGDHPIPDKVTAAASQAFANLVQQSRGGIQKCYQQILKKNSGLQAKSIMLMVSATFSGTGAFQNASFSPSIGTGFDDCMHAIATKWQMPTNSPAMTFVAPVALTPT